MEESSENGADVTNSGETLETPSSPELDNLQDICDTRHTNLNTFRGEVSDQELAHIEKENSKLNDNQKHINLEQSERELSNMIDYANISSPDNFNNSENKDEYMETTDISDDISKKKTDESLLVRDELDFEEDKESGEDSGGEDVVKKAPVNKEEGEVSEDEEDDGTIRQEPKTVCRFFNKGQCTWGSSCRFLHPGVSDKGNYNMFAAPKQQNQSEEQTEEEKDGPRDVRPYVPPATGMESAWERGLRHAKEMMKRASKRRETDADFEEKRLNLSLGQAELDRENDYYTRPASPVHQPHPGHEHAEYPDPFERRAVRHFRGGHFENFEVRYKVGSSFQPQAGPHGMRSRRGKYEREVSERGPRRIRPASPGVHEQKPVKERRYPRPRNWKDGGGAPKEAEAWADPWARRKSPAPPDKERTRRGRRTRSYSSGSSSRSSGSSRDSSYSSYSGSQSRSSSGSRSGSSRSSSRSITPPIHPRQQRQAVNARPPRGRGRDHGRNGYNQSRFGQPPNPPPMHPMGPGGQFHGRAGHGAEATRRPANPRDARPRMGGEVSGKPGPNPPLDARPPVRGPSGQRMNPKQVDERVDVFGRTIRRDPAQSLGKRQPKSPTRPNPRRKYSLSPSGSESGSSSGSESGSSRSGSESRSRSRSGSSSSGSSSVSRSPSPAPARRNAVPDKSRRVAPQGVVSYGDSNKSRAIDVAKVSGQKQQIKVNLKKPSNDKRPGKAVINIDDDSGESDTDARILKKRKAAEISPKLPPSKATKVRGPSPSALAALTRPSLSSALAALNKQSVSGGKKPSASRREELLKQLRAVEDAIAKKKLKS